MLDEIFQELFFFEKKEESLFFLTVSLLMYYTLVFDEIILENPESSFFSEKIVKSF